jgi:arylsulfatase A-like enzyme
MKLLHFLLTSLRAMARTLLLLLLLAVLFASYRIMTSEQVDPADKIASKSAYLERIANQDNNRGKRPNVIFILFDDMGFDSFFGSLYSNDMEPFALYRDTSIAVAAPVDQRQLTELYTGEAVSFIDNHAQENFFLYFAHNFPHDPLAVRAERSGKSDAGLYGDVLEEIDDSIGEIEDALRRTHNLDNTLIIISSDNGPWFLGNAGDHRGRKGNTFEGGMRVPFIAHWPAAIPAGRVETAMAMGTDLVPFAPAMPQKEWMFDLQRDPRESYDI